MAYENRNAAYDLSLFEPRKAKTAEIKEMKPQKQPQTKKKTSPAKLVALSLCLLAVFSVFVYSHVQLNESTAEVASATTMLQKAKSDEELLDVELQRLLSLKNIDSYATNELGLCKPENYQIEYIKTEDDNKIKVTNEKKEDTLFDMVQHVVDRIGKWFQ